MAIRTGMLTIKRSAVAAWAGGLRDGVGTVSTDSGVLSNIRYGYKARFDNGPGTNPEELIAAAQATCFSMALSFELDDLHLVPKSIRTVVTVALDKSSDGYAINEIHIELTARVPGLDEHSFDVIVNRAKSDCPVSRLISAPVTLRAKLET